MLLECKRNIIPLASGRYHSNNNKLKSINGKIIFWHIISITNAENGHLTDSHEQIT